MTKIATGLLLFLLCSCNNNKSTSTDQRDTALSSQTIHTNNMDTVVTTAKPMVLNGCYQMMMKRDTAALELTVKDTTVTGSLQYNLYEKDRNTGTLQGVLRNDIIYADYTFQSEGMTSVREVAFKIQDGALLQAVGAVSEQNSKVVFKDQATLQFPTDAPFLKTACR